MTSGQMFLLVWALVTGAIVAAYLWGVRDGRRRQERETVEALRRRRSWQQPARPGWQTPTVPRPIRQSPTRPNPYDWEQGQ